MSSIYSIATLDNISFKLYSDKHYRLYNYNKSDTLPQLLKKYRLNHNMSFKELGELIGCSQSHLCNIEQNKKIDYPKSKKLIDKLTKLISKDFILYIIVGKIINIFINWLSIIIFTILWWKFMIIFILVIQL